MNTNKTSSQIQWQRYSLLTVYVFFYLLLKFHSKKHHNNLSLHCIISFRGDVWRYRLRINVLIHVDLRYRVAVPLSVFFSRTHRIIMLMAERLGLPLSLQNQVLEEATPAEWLPPLLFYLFAQISVPFTYAIIVFLKAPQL